MKPEAATAIARARIEGSAASVTRLLEPELLERVTVVACELREALTAGRKVLFFGNGGSAAVAQHLAAELVGRFLTEREGLPALALADSAATVTAIANDFSFDDVFARQVAAHGLPGDVAVGMSTSGRSENVARGLRAALERGCVTVALTGAEPGPVGAGCAHVLAMPAADTATVQEAHMVVGHVLCEIADSARAAG